MGSIPPREVVLASLKPALWALAFFLVVLWGLLTLPIPLDLNMLFSWTPEFNMDQRAFLYLRLPRFLLALGTGATLSVSGAVVQGVFQNPLASPELMGITGGASLGAVLAIWLVPQGETNLWIPLASLLGGLGAALLVGAVGRRHLILAGMALSGILGALVSLALWISREYEVRQFLFWTLGSLENRRWDHVLWALPLQGLVLLAIGWTRRDLDYFHLGPWSAQAAGFPWKARRRWFLGWAVLGTTASVAAVGPLGFLGLMVPHGVRRLVGAAHNRLIPWTIVFGSVFLAVLDLGAQTVAFPLTFPVGLITALAGGPFLLLLLRRDHGT